MAAVPAKTKKKGKHYSDYVLNVPKEITNIHTDEKFKQLGEIGAVSIIFFTETKTLFEAI